MAVSSLKSAFKKADLYNELLSAVRRGSESEVEQLIENGADVTTDDSRVLRSSARLGRAEIIPMLIEAGADVNACEGEALRSAAFHGFADVVKILLENGADIKIKDSRWQETAVEAAKRGSNCEKTLALLQGILVQRQEDLQVFTPMPAVARAYRAMR